MIDLVLTGGAAVNRSLLQSCRGQDPSLLQAAPPVVAGFKSPLSPAVGVHLGHLHEGIVTDAAAIQTLSELGVVLLMFSLGLEFSLQRLLRIGFGVVVTALLQCSVMFSLGFAVSEAFGWSVREGLFIGAMLAISSTTIIAKAFEEGRSSATARWPRSNRWAGRFWPTRAGPVSGSGSGTS